MRGLCDLVLLARLLDHKICVQAKWNRAEEVREQDTQQSVVDPGVGPLTATLIMKANKEFSCGDQ